MRRAIARGMLRVPVPVWRRLPWWLHDFAWQEG